MLKTVTDIIKECRQNEELMSYLEFKRCIGEMFEALNRTLYCHNNGEESDKYLKIFWKICDVLADYFEDENENLISWIRGDPCIMYSPNQNEYVLTVIQDNSEAIYYCLIYCMMHERGEKPDREFMDCLEQSLADPYWDWE